MLKLFLNSNSLANKLRLRWAAHYSRVTGKTTPTGFSFNIFDSIAHAPNDIWDKTNLSKNIFLSTAYLSALEKAPPENLKFKYAIISKENTPVGIAYFQILELNHRRHKSPLKLLGAKKKTVISNIHEKIADTATFRLLICGNALISGEHGFSLPTITDDLALHVIAEITYLLRKSLTPHISVTLIKDIHKETVSMKKVLHQFGYYSFDAGPNMTVPIRSNWKTFDDYLKEMKSKYRKRATSAIKKGSTLQRINLSLDEIIQYRDELFTLYGEVVNKANFKTFILSPDFFIELKRHLGEMFVCEGYFLNSKMVGFTTRIFNDRVLEGYSHGVQYERNKEFELYQNFLLNDVKTAISEQSSYINTGRTSMAMKSSIGAIPSEMVCYMRFSGKISNQFLKPLIFFIKPSNEYCRNPFAD